MNQEKTGAMTDNKLLIKVCGMTDRGNIRAVAALQPDLLGFIFHPPSPRDVSGKITQAWLNELPATIKKVAVTVNASLPEVQAIVRHYGFDAVQLHGEESPPVCRELRRDCLVIKTFSVGAELPASLPDYDGCCDYFLFDTAGHARGGSGRRFDHSLLRDYGGPTPFFLAGGIAAEDASGLAQPYFDKLCGVDLNSRFEIRPGIKDPALLEAFIRRIHQNA